MSIINIRLGEIIFHRDNQFLVGNHHEIDKLIKLIDIVYNNYQKKIDFSVKIWVVAVILCLMDTFPLLLTLQAENYINTNNYVSKYKN